MVLTSQRYFRLAASQEFKTVLATAQMLVVFFYRPKAEDKTRLKEYTTLAERYACPPRLVFAETKMSYLLNQYEIKNTAVRIFIPRSEPDKEAVELKVEWDQLEEWLLNLLEEFREGVEADLPQCNPQLVLLPEANEQTFDVRDILQPGGMWKERKMTEAEIVADMERMS